MGLRLDFGMIFGVEIWSLRTPFISILYSLRNGCFCCGPSGEFWWFHSIEH